MNPSDIRKPNVSEDLAIELVLRLYGMKVISTQKMVSYNDQNYYIQVSSEHNNPYIRNIESTGYTLKITNTERSSQADHFDSLHAALIHLDHKGIRVPLPVPNLDGSTWKMEKVPLLNGGSEGSENSYKCGIHLFTFIPGQPVSAVAYTPSLLYNWGSMLSRLHIATEDFTSPFLKKKRIFWNLEHIPDLRPFMKGLDNEKTALVTEILEQFSEKVEKHLSNLQKGFIHGDFNENNILCHISKSNSSDEQEYDLDGVLDFEDMHYGTYVWDVGVMLAYSLLDCDTMDPLEGAGHVLAGYLKYRSLDHLEMSLLKMCIACRLCQSLVLGAYSHSQDPSNSYLIMSARTGWDRLRQVWDTKDEDLLTIWKEIENSYHHNH